MTEKFITKEYAKKLLPKRKQESNKGTFGNVLNIAGSKNYRGAAFLSTKSALKIGAGYVELAAIDEVINTVSILCPEAVLIPLAQKNGTVKNIEYKKIIDVLPKIKVLLFGCGISSMDRNQTEIENFTENLLESIKDIKIPVIIDADGLNIIARLKICKLPQKVILTPHPMELSRLLEVDVSDIQNDRVKYAKTAAKKFKSIVILKGQNTIITDGKNVYMNKHGNSALAKAGTGDVLAGIVAGLCAQGADIFDASVLGVYIHSLAGEIASEELSQYSVNASELINFLPNAINKILK